MMRPIVRVSPQPKSFDFSSANVTANRPVADRNRPRKSTLRFSRSPRDSGMLKIVPARTAMPIGTLM